jgi:hypothetical protein
LAPAVVVVAVVAELPVPLPQQPEVVAVLPAALLPVVALVVLLLQVLALLLREAQLLRPVLLPVVEAVLLPVAVVAVVVLVQGLVASEILRSR